MYLLCIVSELWAVINNAGVCIPGELQWLTWEQCQRSIQVNLEGAVRITKTFFPLLQKSSGELHYSGDLAHSVVICLLC